MRIVRLVSIIGIIAFILGGALFSGILPLIGSAVLEIKNNMLPYIPIEIRVGIFLGLLGLFVALAKKFF